MKIFQETLESGRVALPGIGLKSHWERLRLEIRDFFVPRKAWKSWEWAAQGVVELLSMEIFPKNMDMVLKKMVGL